jgi:alanyl-tRNA synthetase
MDSREMQKILCETFGAKGGGKPAMIQGSVSAEEEQIRGILP